MIARHNEALQLTSQQVAGRVGFFLRVDDFQQAYARMHAAGVEFVSAPRVEAYGTVAVFRDLEGNHWDVLGPPADTSRILLQTNARSSAHPPAV